MASYMENAYSLVHQDNAADIPSVSTRACLLLLVLTPEQLQDFKNQLERGTDETKVGVPEPLHPSAGELTLQRSRQ
jgi:coatomer subunit beta